MVGLALLLILAYGEVVHGVFVWDDTYVVEKNLFIRDAGNLPDLLGPAYFDRAETGHYTRSGEQSYRPVVTLSHFLDHALFGRDPGGYHAMSLFYHWGACLALAALLLALGLGRSATVAGTLLFALHPALSEAVIVVSYREDILAAAAICLALILHLRGRTGSATCAFLLGAFSKQSAVVFLPLVVAADWLRCREGASSATGAFGAARRKQGRAWVIYAIASALYSWIVLVLLVDPAVGPASYPGGSFASGIATSLRVLARYVSLIVAPIGLQVDPHFPPSSGLSDPWALASGAGLLLLVLAIARLLPPWPGRFLGLWFFIALAPVAGLYPLPNYIAERYLYLPMMGVCGVAGWGFGWLVRRSRGERGASSVPWLALALISAALVFVDRARSSIVQSEEAFFREMIRTNPLSVKGHEGLGSALFGQSRIDEAVRVWEQAVSLGPNSPIAHHNLGLAYLRQNRRVAALGVFNRALQLQPSFVESRYQRAVLMREEGDASGAETEQRRVLEINPNFIPAKFQLAYLLDRRGDTSNAIALYQEIVAVHPGYAKAWKNLGVLHLNKLNDPDAAAVYFRHYLELVPGDPQRAMIQRVVDGTASR
ncbi:MAG: hypothetical protein CL908_10875 [Deltaproteobacteria bacterium]|nr:hypothetical protein [Deltaproteobacteria bacterium]